MFKVQLFFFFRINHQKNSSSNANFKEAIVVFDDEQSLSLELSDIEEFAMDNHEISIEYDYDVELIDNYVEWSTSEFLEE